jgi:hypothetical protein
VASPARANCSTATVAFDHGADGISDDQVVRLCRERLESAKDLLHRGRFLPGCLTPVPLPPYVGDQLGQGWSGVRFGGVCDVQE